MLHVNEKFAATIPHQLTSVDCKHSPTRVMVNNFDRISLQTDHLCLPNPAYANTRSSKEIKPPNTAGASAPIVPPGAVVFNIQVDG